ncbi:TPA: FAD-dependent oxidoreductase [Streptococcus suis]|nr:FAD-dependent oxidoreductase [Streptococcus suis]HEM6345203.1 FAD-dependent oxidoreductase [Streptococcus suis]HEM6347017.1 FAD-dependent oxidoreductase [Streptococcus suis]
MDIVIIGASFAGLSAAIECRTLYENARVTVIDCEEEVGYFPNALNWKLTGKISDWHQARIELLDQVLQLEITCQFSTECIDISPENSSITLEHNGKRDTKKYDKLILAMGASQSWDWSDQSIEPFFIKTKTYSQLQHSFHLLSKARSVAVIGAGQIGLESLDALSRLDLELHVFEAQDSILAKYVDAEMVENLGKALKERGIILHLGETVNRIVLNEGKQGLEVSTMKGSYQVDLVLPSTNLRPNQMIGKEKFELLPNGTIWTDDYLETSQKNIFAVGDLVSLPVDYFGRAYYPMIQHAIMTGRMASQNLFAKKSALSKAQRIVSTHVFGYSVTSLGLTESEATLWLDSQSIRIQRELSKWDSRLVDFKLIVEKETGRILGSQLVSESDCFEQMNTLSLAISQGLTVYDLVKQSWLCLPGKTPLIPLMVEAAQEWIRQNNGEKEEEYAD